MELYFRRQGYGFTDFCRSVVDIMNSDEFILEVPVELRMHRKPRKKDDNNIISYTITGQESVYTIGVYNELKQEAE